MTDCPRGDMRDRLPDLLSGRLEAQARADVERHVAVCTECAAELALLRGLRRTLTRTSAGAVDPGRVAAAVRHRVASRPAERARPRRWGEWGLAAAATLLVTGGLTIAAVRRAPRRAELGTAELRPLVQPARPAGLMFDGGVGDLDDRDIEQLLQDVDSLSGVPAVDPAPVLRGSRVWAP